jgi:hypothetical protein
LIFVAALCAGCGAAVHLPPVDLAQPGWRTLQGQAVWQPPRHRPEMAGDLLLATNVNGDFFLQFSKTPFTVATAEVSGGKWQIEFGDHEHHWSGRGAPPDLFAWFELPRLLGGAPPAARWQWERRPGGQWRLQNPRSGESLEGRFFP